jgi:hypothetical protein
MLRKLVGSLVLLILFIGLALADDIRAVIVKVDGGQVTFKEFKGKGQFGDERTLPVADAVKVVKGKINRETKKFEAGEPIEDGLKNKMFSKIGEKGIGGLIVTDDDNKKITEIRVFEKRKGRNK